MGCRLCVIEGVRNEKYTSDMFKQLDARPRGFSGRPLFALIFAVMMGILVNYACSRLRLNDLTGSVIIAAIVAIVGYVWYRIENSR